jgi:HNH endonuclease
MEGTYEESTYASVLYDFPDYTFYSDGRATNKRGQFLGHTNDKEGYVITSFKDRWGKRHKKRLHIMIMWAFSGQAPMGRDVDHKNQVKDDNRYANLQYLSRYEHRKKTLAENPGSRKKIAKRLQKPVIGYHEANNIYQRFESIRQAMIHIGESTKTKGGNIKRSIDYGIKVKGWKFTFEDADNEAMATETWTPLHLEGRTSPLQVSNMGRVMGRNKKPTCGSLNSGYYKFQLKLNGKSTSFGVHQLVCLAYHGPKPDWASSVNHRNENPQDNRAENLEWSNPNHQARSWRTKVNLFKDDSHICSFDSISEAADFLNCSIGGVCNCLNGCTTSIKGFRVEREVTTKQRRRRKTGQMTVGCNAVYRLDENKRDIQRYNSVMSAINEIFPDIEKNKVSGKHRCLYMACITGTRAYGHFWRLEIPPNNIEELARKEKQRHREKAARRRSNKMINL